MKVRVNRLHAPILRALPGPVSVLHADLDARLGEALLAMALSCGGEAAIIAADGAEALRWHVERWAERLGVRVDRQRVGQARRLQIGSAGVWISPPEELPPVRQLKFAGVLGADRISQTPLVWLRSRLVDGAGLVVCGGMPERETWWSVFQGDSTSIKLPAPLVVAAFPDQAGEVDRTARNYPRRMLLEDAYVAPSPFIVFARQRLRVRTEKRIDQLSKIQQAEAAKQPGAAEPVVSLDLSAVQRRYFAMKRLGRQRGHRLFVTVKYRRAGITVGEQGAAYRQCVEYPNTAAMFLADTDPRSKRIFAIARRYQDLDPNQPPLAAPPSKSEMQFANGSSFLCTTARGKASRGEGVSIIHWTEVPYSFKGPSAEADAKSLLSALTEAAPNGEVTMEGTPCGRELLYHTYKGAKDGTNSYWPIFLRWFDDPRNTAGAGTFDGDEVLQSLDDRERFLIGEYGLSLAQIAFRRQKVKDLGGLFQQEFPEDDETCFFVAGTSYFNAKLCADLLEGLEATPGELWPGSAAMVRQWSKATTGRRYVLGVDTSEGVPGGDPSGIGVLDVTDANDFRPAYCLHGLMRPAELAFHVNRVANLYAVDGELPTIGVERQNHGHAVIAVLENKTELVRPTTHGGAFFHYAKDRAGWSTDPTSRPVLLAEFEQATRDGFRVLDRELAAEMSTFVMGRSGKFAAAAGMHDDRVMKWAIALQMAGVPRIDMGPDIVFV